jgi:ankyrin repeat protein
MQKGKWVLLFAFLSTFAYGLEAVSRYDIFNDIDDDIDENDPILWSLNDISDEVTFNQLLDSFFKEKSIPQEKKLSKQYANKLHFLVCQYDGNIELTRQFQDATYSVINVKDENGKTALHLAAQYGHKRNFVELLLCGADHGLLDRANLLAVDCCANNLGGNWIRNFMAMLEDKSEQLAAAGEDSSLKSAMKGILHKNLGDFDRPVRAWMQEQSDKEFFSVKRGRVNARRFFLQS